MRYRRRYKERDRAKKREKIIEQENVRQRKRGREKWEKDGEEYREWKRDIVDGRGIQGDR